MNYISKHEEVKEQIETEVESVDGDIVDLIMADIIAPFIAVPVEVEKKDINNKKK